MCFSKGSIGTAEAAGMPGFAAGLMLLTHMQEADWVVCHLQLPISAEWLNLLGDDFCSFVWLLVSLPLT